MSIEAVEQTDPHGAAPPPRTRIHPSWARVLAEELAAPSMTALRELLLDEQRRGTTVYPRRAQIFAAFDATPFEDVRVVILGQDPYHGHGQAMGLSFSVPRGVAVPPSLRNVFAEIETSVGAPRPAHGDLTAWTQRGVLLLNATLTVRAGAAGSHRGRGWEQLTAAALDALSREREGIVFLLWGRSARDAGARIDRTRHLVLTAPHPSPLSAHTGFLGCRHFALANEYLERRGEPPIDWSLPEEPEMR